MRKSFFPGAKPPIWVSRRHQPWYDVRFFTFEGVTSGGEGVTFWGRGCHQGVTASPVRIYTMGWTSKGAPSLAGVRRSGRNPTAGQAPGRASRVARANTSQRSPTALQTNPSPRSGAPPIPARYRPSGPD